MQVDADSSPTGDWTACRLCSLLAGWIVSPRTAVNRAAPRWKNCWGHAPTTAERSNESLLGIPASLCLWRIYCDLQRDWHCLFKCDKLICDWDAAVLPLLPTRLSVRIQHTHTRTHAQLLHLHLYILIWKQEIKKSFSNEFPSKHSIITVKREHENERKRRTAVKNQEMWKF